MKRPRRVKVINHRSPARDDAEGARDLAEFWLKSAIENASNTRMRLHRMSEDGLRRIGAICSSFGRGLDSTR